MYEYSIKSKIYANSLLNFSYESLFSPVSSAVGRIFFLNSIGTFLNFPYESSDLSTNMIG